MYRPHDVHRTPPFSALSFVAPFFIALMATLPCLPACGGRIVVARELALEAEAPDAAAPALDAGKASHKHPDSDDDNDDDKHDDDKK